MTTATFLSLCLLLLHCFLAANAIASKKPNPFPNQADILKKFMTKNAGKTQLSNPSNRKHAAPSIRSRIYPQTGLKDHDKISQLPGQPDGVDFNQYGGYVTVDQAAGRALFYYFVEAAHNNSASCPLLIWFNGGPGCSSLGFGAMSSLGPFRVMSDGKTLYKNPYTWIEGANIVFLESPAGVGFSYSNTTADETNNGDLVAAEDAYVFLLNWLERFPEYKTRDLYIAGESYAGHYVPQLAHTILQYNKMPSNNILNLKGIMIGNPLMDDETFLLGEYEYLWSHAMLPDSIIEPIRRNCKVPKLASEDCESPKFEAEIMIKPLNAYDIYGLKCTNPGITSTPKTPSIEEFDECNDSYLSVYLNDAEVQKALHANVTGIGHPWTSCREDINGNWKYQAPSVLPLFKDFIANNLRVLVYSGDTDAVVSVTATRYDMQRLQLAVKEKWQPWGVNNEIIGYRVVYEGNVTFTTIRGSGHVVPSYQPRRAFQLFKHFIEDKAFPTLQSNPASPTAH